MNINTFLQKLKETEGTLSVQHGVIHFEDGTSFDLNEPPIEGVEPCAGNAAPFDPAEEVTVTVEDLLNAANAEELESMLIECAEELGYFGSLDVSFDYWHYGRHAEFARQLGMPDLARLFSAAWQIDSRVLREDDPEARENAKEQIKAEFPDEATITLLAEHPAVTSLQAIHDQPNCRHEVEAQLGQEVFYPLSMDNEYGDMMKLAAEIRDLIFDEGDGTMQGAMIGNPVECLAFAKWWIQRAKGVKPDQDWFAKPEGGGNKLVEALRTISGQDPVEMALDPQWAARVSRIALTECGYKA